ncbi:MAG TPA: hypothetical protein VFJ29_07995, partial [Candidatus Kapabacteria bacterium]|nr:hypothetical protein [Candidatus Kapabacteria bacterium]
SLVFTSAFKACSTIVKMPGQGIKDSTITLTPILGKRTRETMTPFGKVTSTTIVDTPNIDDQLLLLLSQNASDLSNIWMEFGGNPVKPGDTWKIQQKDTNDAPGNGKVYTTTNFQYHYLHNADTLNHTCAVIKYTTDVTVEGGFTNPISHTDLTVDGDGKGSGTIYFDLAKGAIVANNSKIEANQSLSVQGQTDPVLTSSKSVTAHLVIAE